MKTLLVVGASSDVGGALINELVMKYDKIWAHFFHWNQQLEDIREKYHDKIDFIQADLMETEQINNMIEIIKGEDCFPEHIVYLPMPVNQIERFMKTSWDQYESNINVSLKATIRILQAFLPNMVKQSYGKVVFMLTSFTLGIPPKYQSVYTTAKYALLGLMKSLASEYIDKGITFNGISPDMIKTKYIEHFPHLMIEEYEAGRPRKQLLKIEDVLPAICFFLSSGADKITGENILIQ